MVQIDDNRFAFIFSAQPRLLIYSLEGEKLDDISIEMPWYGRKGGADINPFMSEQFGHWMARPLWRSVHQCSDGFILSSYTEDHSIIDIYSFNGDLVKHFSIPRKPLAEVGLEDSLFDAVELGGRYWAMLWESEACINEVIEK